MAPHSRRASHPNHVSSDRQERVRSFYGDETYARLVAVKDRLEAPVHLAEKRRLAEVAAG